MFDYAIGRFGLYQSPPLSPVVLFEMRRTFAIDRCFSAARGSLREEFIESDGETAMDENRVKGTGKQISGSIKEGVGKVTGDTKTQAEGTAEKAAGKVQNTVDGAKDAARDSLKK